MTKHEAVVALMKENTRMARAADGSTAAAKRIVQACRVLGLDDAEIRQTMAWLDYCDAETGESYRPLAIKRVWP